MERLLSTEEYDEALINLENLLADLNDLPEGKEGHEDFNLIMGEMTNIRNKIDNHLETVEEELIKHLTV